MIIILKKWQKMLKKNLMLMNNKMNKMNKMIKMSKMNKITRKNQKNQMNQKNQRKVNQRRVRNKRKQRRLKKVKIVNDHKEFFFGETKITQNNIPSDTAIGNLLSSSVY